MIASVNCTVMYAQKREANMHKRYNELKPPKEWLDALKDLRPAADMGPLALVFKWHEALNDEHILLKAQSIADILLQLGFDNETIAAALIYPLLQAETITLDEITAHYGETVRRLLRDTLSMQSLKRIKQTSALKSQQIENRRKMLLAMVTDVRSVILILAERLYELRNYRTAEKTEQIAFAQETIQLYAPLANRLGVWSIKWEMEDWCLRYLHAEEYIEIAKSLSVRRADREAYIANFLELLKKELDDGQITRYEITGRVKHIYSIYKKMQRKSLSLNQIYDMTAVRVILPNVEECYRVLAIIHSAWEMVSSEFDDYIANPKPNGYRSIHTVILGPNQHLIEVQIRTNEMHQESELGVAAHWRYKEGILQTAHYEAKIALLRQLMAWQREVNAEEEKEANAQDLFADRVYAFTPQGDILDLPKGATPLDFAYQIHSELGHRCRGAKVDGNIVSLTYQLKTGERVEILTAKRAQPSRDWLSVHAGYLYTPRARAKVQHWFRVHDSTPQVDTRPQPKQEPVSEQPVPEPLIETLGQQTVRPADIQILGVNNVLTHIAQCCKPLPGDGIIGYISRQRGITVHRNTCNNIRNMSEQHQQRLLSVNWGEREAGNYPADLQLRVQDEPGLLRDITILLAGDKVTVIGVQIFATNEPNVKMVYLTVQIANREQLEQAMQRLRQITQVVEVTRR